MSSSVELPSTTLAIRENASGAYFDAIFRYDGREPWRCVGPAWMDHARDGSWQRRRGRIEDGYFDERRAYVRAAEIVAEFVRDYSERERLEYERKVRGMTLRELAHGYLDWMERVKGSKPSTLASHRLLLAEPGRPHKRGGRKTPGPLAALGDKPVRKITPAEVKVLLDTVAATGVKPATMTGLAVSSARSSTTASRNSTSKTIQFFALANAESRRQASSSTTRLKRWRRSP